MSALSPNLTPTSLGWPGLLAHPGTHCLAKARKFQKARHRALHPACAHCAALCAHRLAAWPRYRLATVTATVAPGRSPTVG